MSDYNRVIMMGRLTAKPELRYTPSGDAVTTLRLATSRRYKTKSGEDREDTCFIDASVWRKQAETCSEYLVKGQKVLVEGSLVMRQWETSSKEKRTNYEIQALRVLFMEKPRNASSASSDEKVSGGELPPPSEDEEEIPF
ncbi:MAG: hypothetical protein AUJ18_05250 [Candidatus Hydrogenedentes bacterium CG1_02_42_14]|nr:MAG: hypothetical protein AUJ18_05250 [Candidatus Hydrogenedentes bacterium CG1_02_42_14]